MGALYLLSDAKTSKMKMFALSFLFAATCFGQENEYPPKEWKTTTEQDPFGVGVPRTATPVNLVPPKNQQLPKLPQQQRQNSPLVGLKNNQQPTRRTNVQPRTQQNPLFGQQQVQQPSYGQQQLSQPLGQQQSTVGPNSSPFMRYQQQLQQEKQQRQQQEMMKQRQQQQK